MFKLHGVHVLQEVTTGNYLEGNTPTILYDWGITTPAPHTSIFKYISLDNERSRTYLEGTLNVLQLYGSSCSQVNDPFEFQPVSFDDITPKIHHTGTKLFEKDQTTLNNNSEKIKYIKEKIDNAHNYLKYMRRNYKLICFSDRWDSPLQWAHYANNYYGACLQFSSLRPTHRDCRIGYVNYSVNRPIYPLSLATKLVTNNGKNRLYASSIENDKMLFFNKSLDWSYEREIRIIYNCSKGEFISFNPNMLMSIILGPLIKPELKDYIIRIVKNSNLSYLPIYESKLSLNSYSVDVDWEHPIK